MSSSPKPKARAKQQTNVGFLARGIASILTVTLLATRRNQCRACSNCLHRDHLNRPSSRLLRACSRHYPPSSPIPLSPFKTPSQHASFACLRGVVRLRKKRIIPLSATIHRTAWYPWEGQFVRQSDCDERGGPNSRRRSLWHSCQAGSEG